MKTPYFFAEEEPTVPRQGSHGSVLFLPRWEPGHPRYDALPAFCLAHEALPDHEPHFTVWSADGTANCAAPLCHMVDKMLSTPPRQKRARFR